MPILKFQNRNIHYSTFGTGQPVILLHGFGEDSSIWNTQIDFLQKHCNPITVDLPGSGESSTSAAFSTIDEYADIVNFLIKELRLNKIILLGHSMGGYITLSFVEKYPHQLKAYGLVHSTAFADTEEKKDTRRKGIEFIRKNGAHTFLKTTIPNLFSTFSKSERLKEIEELIAKAATFSDEALIAYYEAMINRPDRTAILASSETPVLFILGTEDVAAPINDVLKQVHLPKTSYIHILENVGHMSMIETPEILNAHLLKFITEV